MRWSSVRVFVRPCSGNRLQSTSHENSYRGPTGDLFDLIFFYTYSWVNGLCFGYFQIFPERSPFDRKITLTLTPFPYVRRLLDLRVYSTVYIYRTVDDPLLTSFLEMFCNDVLYLLLEDWHHYSTLCFAECHSLSSSQLICRYYVVAVALTSVSILHRHSR